MLIKLGANVSEYDDSFWTPLHYAVDEGHAVMVKLLVENEADTIKPGAYLHNTPATNLGWTPLHMATGEETAILKQVLIGFQRTGKNINELRDNVGGQTPLHWALGKRPAKNLGPEHLPTTPKVFVDNVKLLLAAGADPLVRNIPTMQVMPDSPRNDSNISPLELAKQQDLVEVVKLFEINIREKMEALSGITTTSNENLLMVCFDKETMKRDIISFTGLRSVLEQCRTKLDGNTLPTPELALRRAAATGKLNVIIMLFALVKDLDANQAGPTSGNNALSFAVMNRHQEVVNYLISNMPKKSFRIEYSYKA